MGSSISKQTAKFSELCNSDTNKLPFLFNEAKVPPQITPVASKTEENDSFSTLRAAGYNSQVEFLESKIITPFLNRVVYENSGQLMVKLPRSLGFFGTNKAGMLSIVRALVAELSTKEGKTWSYFSGSRSQVGTGDGYIRSLFKKAMEQQPALIYLEGLNTWDTTWVSTLGEFISEKIRRAKPGQILVIGSMHVETREEINDQTQNRMHWYCKLFPVLLHFPGLPLLPLERRGRLLTLTSGWRKQPSEHILEVMTTESAALWKNGDKEWESGLRNLVAGSYRNCVERYLTLSLDKMGGAAAAASAIINPEEIDPTLQDWEEALKIVLGQGKIVQVKDCCRHK